MKLRIIVGIVLALFLIVIINILAFNFIYEPNFKAPSTPLQSQAYNTASNWTTNLTNPGSINDTLTNSSNMTMINNITNSS